MEGITRREAGRRAGVDESTVRKHLRSGALDKAVLADGSLHSEKVLKLLSEVVQRGPRTPTYLTTAKTRRARAQVEKLGDEVAAYRASAIHVDDVDRLRLEQALPVVRAFQSLSWDAGNLVAGKPAADAFRALRELVEGAFKRASDADAAVSFEDDDGAEPEPDIMELSPNELAARRLALQAEKLEIETLISRGEMRAIGEVVREFEARNGAAKSMLAAISHRLSSAAETATPEEFEAMVDESLVEAFAELCRFEPEGSTAA